MTPAEEILTAKLALEREIAQQIIFAGRRYILDWEGANGSLSPIAKHDHHGRLVAVLQRHYARVTMVMTGRRPPLNPAIEEAALSLRHLDSMQRRARHHASLIIASIDRELDKAGTVIDGQKADTTGIETKEEVPQATAGYVMSVIEAASSAIKKLKTFIGSIANAQTNGPAEEARQEQVKYTLEDDPANANAKLVQVWHNVGDNRVRGAPHNPRRSKFDHWTAEGQEVAADEPFVISGELLRFPGDSGLGASLGNLVNCRCSVSTIAIREDGSRVEMHRTPSAPARRQRRPGDRVGANSRLPGTPTSRVTLNGTTRARVILKDGTSGTLRQVTPTKLEVRIGSKVVGRADIGTGGQLRNVQIAEGHRHQGIEELMRRSAIPRTR
jgi:hypothetical protein